MVLGCWGLRVREVHEDTAVGQEPAQGREGQRDDMGGGIC